MKKGKLSICCRKEGKNSHIRFVFGLLSCSPSQKFRVCCCCIESPVAAWSNIERTSEKLKEPRAFHLLVWRTVKCTESYKAYRRGPANTFCNSPALSFGDLGRRSLKCTNSDGPNRTVPLPV